MGRKIGVFVIFCALVLAQLGCGGAESDPFAVFRGGFCADVTGELNGIAFSAMVEAEPSEGGEQAVTVTFYAPSGLSGTVLRRDNTGAVSLSAGKVRLESLESTDFSAFFGLFPTSGEVTAVSLDEQGRTQVIFAGGSLLLLPDGTPCTVSTAAGRVRLLQFVAA